MIVCNTRNLGAKLTGVQRYTSAVLEHLPLPIDRIEPSRPLPGMTGHAWEQLVLPWQLRGRLLWSPSTSGPLTVDKQVISLMDMSIFDHPEWFSGAYVRWYRYLMPQLVGRSRAVITISEFSKRRILHHFPHAQGKVHVTPLGFDDRFRPREPGEVSPRLADLQLPPGPYLLCLGSVTARKNVSQILKAWALAAHRLPGSPWLVFVGDRPDARIFGDHQLQAIPERVFFTGHVADRYLPYLYAGAVASVYVSLYEGFGLPPLESMASGTPVVASETTAMPEVVGDAAALVDPTSAEAISIAIEKLVTDTAHRDALRQQGLRRAAGFSWRRTAALTADILRSCDD